MDHLTKIRLIITILTLLALGQITYGQGSTIKGFIWPPVLLGQYRPGTLTVTYERALTNNKTIGFTLNAWGYGYIKQTELFDNPVLYNNYLYGNFIIDLRKYLIKPDKEKNFINNCYGSIYSIFSRNQVWLEGGCKNFEGACYSGTHLGLGISAGRKNYLTKNKKIFVDFGVGIAGTLYIYRGYARGPLASIVDKDPEFKLLPRAILTLGVNLGTKKKENKNGS